MIGIVFGLYCHISIALFVVGFFWILTYGITKNKKIKRYDEVLAFRKWLMVFLACLLMATLITKIENEKYEQKNKQMEMGKNYVGVVVSNPIQKEQVTQYQVEIKKIDKQSCNVMVNMRITQENNLEYGDEISFLGEYRKPDTARNDKGFNNKQYLQSNRYCSEQLKRKKSKFLARIKEML